MRLGGWLNVRVDAHVERLKPEAGITLPPCRIMRRVES